MSLKGYRTLIFAGLVFVINVLRKLYPDVQLPGDELLGLGLDQFIAIFDTILVPVIMVALRKATTGPIGTKY